MRVKNPGITALHWLILLGLYMVPLVGCGGGDSADVIADKSEVEAYLAEHGDQSASWDEEEQQRE